MDDSKSPFVAGARVALLASGFDEHRFIREDRVGKVFKNGNFKLENDDQQWRPLESGVGDTRRWRADKTGRRWDRHYLEFWDEQTDAKIKELADLTGRRSRLKEVQRKVERLRATHITNDFLTALEALLAERAKDKP